MPNQAKIGTFPSTPLGSWRPSSSAPDTDLMPLRRRAATARTRSPRLAGGEHRLVLAVKQAIPVLRARDVDDLACLARNSAPCTIFRALLCVAFGEADLNAGKKSLRAPRTTALGQRWVRWSGSPRRVGRCRSNTWAPTRTAFYWRCPAPGVSVRLQPGNATLLRHLAGDLRGPDRPLRNGVRLADELHERVRARRRRLAHGAEGLRRPVLGDRRVRFQGIHQPVS